MRIFLQLFFLMTAFSATAFAGTPGEVMVGDYLRETTLNGFNGQTKMLSDFKALYHRVLVKKESN